MLILLLAAGVSTQAPGEGWRVFRDAPAAFSVELPEAPTHEHSSRFTPVGRIRSQVHLAFRQAAEFRIEVHEVPAVARWLLSEQGVLERAATDLLSDEGAQNAVVSVERQGKHPARRVVYRDAQGRRAEAWFLLANGRLYVLAAVWPVDQPERPGRDRFFSSFTLR